MIMRVPKQFLKTACAHRARKLLVGLVLAGSIASAGSAGPQPRSDAGGSSEASGKVAISFLYVARETSSVRQYDDRVTTVDTESNTKKADQSEGVSGGKARYDSNDSSSTVRESGGSRLKQADKATYQVTSPENINTAMSQIFAGSGFDVYDYRDVSESCNGLNPSVIYKSFANSDELPRDIRKQAFDAARRCGVIVFATGTLDIGMQDSDPVTGNVRVFVSVRSQVFDLSNTLPRVLASVGPIQYSGMGPQRDVAMRNALQNAATEAAKSISDQLNSRPVN